jgi:hypothetical protein
MTNNASAMRAPTPCSSGLVRQPSNSCSVTGTLFAAHLFSVSHFGCCMAGRSIKHKAQYRALKRKGMSKARAARISNAGKTASRKGGRKAARRRKHG